MSEGLRPLSSSYILFEIDHIAKEHPIIIDREGVIILEEILHGAEAFKAVLLIESYSSWRIACTDNKRMAFSLEPMFYVLYQSRAVS